MSDDSSEEESQASEEDTALPGWLFMLYLAGFLFVLVGIAVVLAAYFLSGGAISGGVVVFIGPFPIFFGVGSSATWLVLIGIIISAFSIILFVIMRKKTAERLD